MLSWAPVATWRQTAAQGEGLGGPPSPWSPGLGPHHRHKPQGAESGIQKPNDSLQPPNLRTWPKKPQGFAEKIGTFLPTQDQDVFWFTLYVATHRPMEETSPWRGSEVPPDVGGNVQVHCTPTQPDHTPLSLQ